MIDVVRRISVPYATPPADLIPVVDAPPPPSVSMAPGVVRYFSANVMAEECTAAPAVCLAPACR